MNSKELIEMIKNNMRDKEISRSELARMTKIPPETIQSYMLGRRTPGADNLLKIFAVLDIKIYEVK